MGVKTGLIQMEGLFSSTSRLKRQTCTYTRRTRKIRDLKGKSGDGCLRLFLLEEALVLEEIKENSFMISFSACIKQ